MAGRLLGRLSFLTTISSLFPRYYLFSLPHPTYRVMLIALFMRAV